MKKIITISVVIFAIFTAWFYSRHPLATTVTIRNHTFTAEVAVTPREKELGLGHRNNLPMDSGMLFVYDHPDKYSFWMKGMRFPLDFIWIDGVTVVDITKYVQPVPDGQPLSVYSPAKPADKVFEVQSGTIDRYGISVGDTVKISD